MSEQIDLESFLKAKAAAPVPPGADDEPETFVCATCGRTTRNEDGAADDMPDSCSDCWVAAHPAVPPATPPADPVAPSPTFEALVGVAAESDRHAILQGDCRHKLWWLKEDSIDAVVTDPPYNLASIQKRFATGAAAKEPRFERLTRGFMGKTWDSEVAFDPATWVEVLRVMKPGAHLLAFGGTRTYHRLACAIEDAGFEIRDSLIWVYGSGFPKSHDLGNGRGTALKPAYEPIILARKPFVGTTHGCVEEYGTGALNIDACRVPTGEESNPSLARRESTPRRQGDGNWPTAENDAAFAAAHPGEERGRWPANLIHDGSDEVLEAFPDSPGQLADLKATGRERPGQGIFGKMPPPRAAPRRQEPRDGATNLNMGPGERREAVNASRFFYCAKASRADREEGCEDLPAQKRDESRNADQPSMNGGEGNAYNRGAAPRKNHHPTVKPTELMRYLCRLITPPGGIVLDPFTGSGSTGKAAMLEGLRFIGCELEAPYVQIAAARIEAASRLTTVADRATSTP